MQSSIIAGVLALVLLSAPAGAQSSQPEVTFGIVGAPGAAGWPLLLAQTLGFFKGEAIAVTFVQGSSPQSHLWDTDFGKWRAFDTTFTLSTAALQNSGKYQVDFGVIPALPPIADLYDPSFTADALR